MFAKKTLVAAAALLAVAGAAQAQSSVKLYGYIEASVGSFEDAHTKGEKARTTQVASGNMMTSFIGLSGSEDLGGGLSAIFAYEFSVAADANAGVGGRHSYIGLKGSWGTFVAGKQDGGNESVAPLYTQASLTGGVSNQGGPLTTIGGGGSTFSNTIAIQRVQPQDIYQTTRPVLWDATNRQRLNPAWLDTWSWAAFASGRASSRAWS